MSRLRLNDASVAIGIEIEEADESVDEDVVVDDEDDDDDDDDDVKDFETISNYIFSMFSLNYNNS